MKSIFCWARVIKSNRYVNIFEAMLTKPGLTWADDEVHYPIATFDSRQFYHGDSIFDVLEKGVIEIELTATTGFDLSSTPGSSYPYQANFLANWATHFDIEACTLDQIQHLDALPNEGWVAVQSDAIVAVKYLNLALQIRFSSGAQYVYAGVDLLLYEQFMNAPSKGKFFTEKIRSICEATQIAV